ncbi:MAG: hypothetical protein Q9164_000150 [Protoblastenia rupestris]
MALWKQVYRHLLFNRFSHDAQNLDPSIRRLGILLLLFDVYLTMIHIESVPQNQTNSSPISNLNVFIQWGFFVLVCAVATLAQHLTIRWLAYMFRLCGGVTSQHEPQDSPVPNGAATPGMALPDPPKPPTPSAISTALFVSSCMSLFPILMIVWRPDEPASPGPTNSPSSTSFLPGFLLSSGRGVGWVRSGVSWAVAVQNLEALRILLGCGYLGAGGLVIAGGASKWIVRIATLGSVGLSEAG